MAALQDRLKELELERSQHRAQLEALSQHVTSRNNSVDLGFSPDGSGRAGEVRPHAEHHLGYDGLNLNARGSIPTHRWRHTLHSSMSIVTHSSPVVLICDAYISPRWQAF